MINSLNLNHLYYFWLIAKEGTVKRAAEKIHLTQPTLSDQIKTLEQRLGKDLFERRSNRLHLTLFGKEVFQHCTAMFNEGEKILSSIDRSSGGALPVNVGVPPDISKHLTCDLLTPIVQDQKIFLSIIEDELPILIEQLKSGKLDMIFSNYLDKSLPKIYVQKKLKENIFYAVCKKESYRKGKFPQLLEDIPFISYTKQSSLHYQIEKFFEKNKLKINKLCEVDDLSLVKYFTISSHSFSVLPDTSIQEDLRNNQLVILGEIPTVESNLTLVYKDLEQNQEIIKLMGTYLGEA